MNLVTKSISGSVVRLAMFLIPAPFSAQKFDTKSPIFFTTVWSFDTSTAGNADDKYEIWMWIRIWIKKLNQSHDFLLLDNIWFDLGTNESFDSGPQEGDKGPNEQVGHYGQKHLFLKYLKIANPALQITALYSHFRSSSVHKRDIPPSPLYNILDHTNQIFSECLYEVHYPLTHHLSHHPNTNTQLHKYSFVRPHICHFI